MLHSAKWAGFLAFAALVACNAASSVHPAAPNTQPALLNDRPASHASWMEPSAKGQRLLYVSDPENTSVYVYGASSNQLVGTLTGFRDPLGECVDAKNDVWIVDYDELVEYAHGGTKQIGSIPVGYYGNDHPYSCAVDPTTGDIAISIINRYQGNDSGFVMICSSPSGCTDYDTRTRVYFYFVSYDKNGNLWVDGLKTTTGAFWLGMRPPGGKILKLTLSGAKITSPGGLVNANGVLSVGSRDSSGNSIIYQVATDGTVTGTTQLLAANGCNQFAIVGNAKNQRVTCPNSTGANVTKYKYPAGGDPLITISGPFAAPFAAVYSN